MVLTTPLQNQKRLDKKKYVRKGVMKNSYTLINVSCEICADIRQWPGHRRTKTPKDPNQIEKDNELEILSVFFLEEICGVGCVPAKKSVGA